VDTGLSIRVAPLERKRAIAADWEISENNQRVRVYRLTAAGRRQLVAERSKWDRLAGAIASSWRPRRERVMKLRALLRGPPQPPRGRARRRGRRASAHGRGERVAAASRPRRGGQRAPRVRNVGLVMETTREMWGGLWLERLPRISGLAEDAAAEPGFLDPRGLLLTSGSAPTPRSTAGSRGSSCALTRSSPARTGWSSRRQDAREAGHTGLSWPDFSR